MFLNSSCCTENCNLQGNGAKGKHSKNVIRNTTFLKDGNLIKNGGIVLHMLNS